MLICTQDNNTFETFDTETGIMYRVSIFDDGSIDLSIDSLSNEMMTFGYQDNQAVSFWKQLSRLNINGLQNNFFDASFKAIEERIKE